MEAKGEVLVLPFFGQGHLFPSMELCKRFSSFNYKAILVIPSNLSSSVPSSLRHHPLVEVTQIPSSSPSDSPQWLPPAPPPPEMVDGNGTKPGPGPGPNPFHQHNQQLGSGIEAFLSDRYMNPGETRPVCVVIDVMMSWSKEIFGKFDIPAVSFFTSGACSAAMEHAAWEAHVGEMKPGEIRKVDGLPEEMALSYSDLKSQQRRPPSHRGNPPRLDGPDGPPGSRKFGGPPPPGGRQRWLHEIEPRPNGPDGPPSGRKFGGPPSPGDRPRWLDESEGSIALFFNTFDDLEGPFISYMAKKISKPVYGVGPLLPENYWKSFDSILHDGEVRSNRKSNYTEDEVVQWLDSKPAESVTYVSFGSEVGPSLEEYAELGDALGELNRPFIWVIQPGSGRHGPPPGFIGGEPDSPSEEEGYYPHGLDEKVGNRGLIIKGWAPQLLILSHPSLGAFLSHCGWNSTVEAIGRGIPILAWPIRGDQFHNAKLVVKHLKVGHMLLTSEDPSRMVKKDTIKRGIDSLLDDEDVHKQAVTLRSKFKGGFPTSSITSLKSFIDVIIQKN